MSAAATCPNCGSPLTANARFCSQCGQRRIGDADRRLPALLRASAQEVTDLDGRLLPSLIALLFRPGRLSREYRLGRRRRYLSPVGLFLFANLLFFLAPSISDLSLVFEDQYTLQPYSASMRPHLDARIASSGMSMDEFAAAYDGRVGDIAKSMVIAHVPLIAFVTFVLTLRKRFFYADHVVAALHFFAFLMLYFTLAPLTLMPLMAGINALPLVSLPVRLISLALLLAYAIVMLRTAFDLRWWAAVVFVVPFIAGFLGAHYVYRLMQLWIGVLLV